jgi:flagellar hook-basal body complex protein FliE
MCLALPCAHGHVGAAQGRGTVHPGTAEACQQTPPGRVFGPRVHTFLPFLAHRLTSPSIFATPWQKIVSATESVAQSHEHLARKIEADVERPLRDYYRGNREIQAMSNISGNLAATAKEIDTAQKKTAKLRDKGAKAKASSVADAVQECEKAEVSWDSSAPFVFEQLQAIDESRLNHLRDVLTQFQTHEVDQVERNRITAEETLNALLNIETADEIQTWALRMRSGDLPPVARKMSNTGTPSRSLAPPPTTPNPGQADDNRSQRSGSGA